MAAVAGILGQELLGVSPAWCDAILAQRPGLRPCCNLTLAPCHYPVNASPSLFCRFVMQSVGCEAAITLTVLLKR
jgi:hypothetical protein